MTESPSAFIFNGMHVPLPEPPHIPFPKDFSFLQSLGTGLSILILIAILSPVLGVVALYASGPLEQEKTVVIAHGSSIFDIGAQLSQENAVYFSSVFNVAARITGSLKAGEYVLPAGISAFDLAVLMHEGHSVIRTFTAVEGLTSAEIVRLLNDNPVLTGSIKEFPPEGSLLPETYHYSYGDNRASIIARMQNAMHEKLNELWANRDMGGTLKSIEEAVVLASIVEKETGKAEERPRIAGVFFNRLRKNMRLQSDPTVIYAMTNGQIALDRALTRNDLSITSPINTYVNTGLPSQPICNPGRASLEAVLHPENNDFLYFVADGNGGHAFAADLKTHNKNVNLWHRATNTVAGKP